jgi:tripartite ATP-independent transporter DctM subunit
MTEFMPLFMFLVAGLILMTGYPVAFSLAGTALVFSLIGIITGTFDSTFLAAMPSRLFGIMTNETLIAVPLFVFMGAMLERSRIAEQLLDAMTALFGKLRGGLGISVILVGMLMAASTGIVGATVVTMGMMALPTMLKRNYDPAIACGTICASGTLGQIIPPSIILVLLGDVLSSAFQQAQLDMGIFSPETVSVGDLFAGALIPGLILVVMYIIYILSLAWLRPQKVPAQEEIWNESNSWAALLSALLPPLLLIVSVLGSILGGLATPTEAASVGAVGATLLALARKSCTKKVLRVVTRSTLQITSMVFMILIGASLFSLVFRGFGGDDLIAELLGGLPGGIVGAMIAVMLVMFLLGFILDFIEITFVVVPIVGPILLSMGIDPVWLGIMIAINLQTSFLTPPFGFALFYLRGVAPKSVTTGQIYRGVLPFIAIQLLMLVMLAYWPALATWLPGIIYG